MIEVRLFASFREGREKISFLDSKEFKTIADIADYFNIPYEELAISLINGKHSRLDSPVNDGDVVALFPPVGGG